MAKNFQEEFKFAGDLYVDRKREVYKELGCNRGLKYILSGKSLKAIKSVRNEGYSQGSTQGDALYEIPLDSSIHLNLGNLEGPLLSAKPRAYCSRSVLESSLLIHLCSTWRCLQETTWTLTNYWRPARRLPPTSKVSQQGLPNDNSHLKTHKSGENWKWIGLACMLYCCQYHDQAYFLIINATFFQLWLLCKSKTLIR